jgi:fatty acid desaturase
MSTLLTPSLTTQSPDLLHQVNALRQTDNLTNWYYLAREYLFLGLVVGGTIAFYEWLQAQGLSWLWAVPVTLVAITFVGAGQHRIATLAHEGVHYMLFRNRLVNEFVSEWFCMFPMLAVTHVYRVQHLGHHQYPNDPERDPDWDQMRKSGHRYEFPMGRWEFLWTCMLKQMLWLVGPIRYILVRALFKADGSEHSPYRRLTRTSPFVALFSVAYLLGLIGVLTWLVWAEQAMLLALVPAAMLVVAVAVYAAMPERCYTTYLIKSDIGPRWTACLRVVHFTLTLSAIAWLTLLTGMPWWLYYIVLWLVPLGTSFAFFMIMRQIVQHGNADQERFTNTRVFTVNPLIGFAVFPIGHDYHLPHHLFPMVPHYNLRKAHDLLMRTDEYREQAVLVEGYFLHGAHLPHKPTVLDLMTRSNEN